MSMPKIKTMSAMHFTVIFILAFFLQISFFIVPGYLIEEPIETIELKACSIGQIPGNKVTACNTSQIWDKSNFPDMLSRGFVFRLPRVKSSLLRDNTKWRPKLTGSLTIFTTESEPHAVFKEWKMGLLIHHVNCSDPWALFDNSTLNMEQYCESSPWTPIRMPYQQNIYIYHVLPTFSFVLLPDNDYNIILHSPLLQNHGSEVFGMNMTFTMSDNAFTEFMEYPKLRFLVLAMLLTICFEIQMFVHSDSICMHNVAVLQLGIALVGLNLPLEWIPSNTVVLLTKNLWYDFYYFALGWFGVIFFHNYIAERDHNGLRIGTIPTCSLILIFIGFNIFFILHFCLNNLELKNPISKFSSLSMHSVKIITTTMATMAVMYLCHILNVFKALYKVTTSKYGMQDSPDDSKSYQGRYRRYSSFVLASVVICLLITLAEFMYYEFVRWLQWDGYNTQFSAIFSIGVFGMWNIFTLMILYLYIPVRGNNSALSYRNFPIPAHVTATTPIISG